ncbi:hypothetical protein D9619_008534 [Psilocybe cf. subviscida]|uniref:DUF6534 domain-containing protein n=1 Tax=Psilocybe cf. subviscida TaxID=2480587 RepID=A0A8H5BAN0_9AGAR|nr:hypothetical protein D9619_008534 [Psilocybe cf. subviscida]
MSSLDLNLDLNNTFGALLLGTIISSILYGAMCLQAWTYFQRYSDGPLIKSAVTALMYFNTFLTPKYALLIQNNRILESLHSAFSIHAIYYYVILNYLNPTALLKATWSIIVYLNRHVSKRNVPLAVSIAVLELANVGTAVSVVILAFQLELFSDFGGLRKILIPADISLALTVTIDILIAGSLSIRLRLSKTGISDTDRIIDKLVVHAINNGIVTSIASVFCLIFATTEKTSLVYLMFYQCIGHLYSNSMISTLNSQKSRTRIASTSIELSGLHISEPKPLNIVPPSVSSKSATTGSTKSESPEMDIEIDN